LCFLLGYNLLLIDLDGHPWSPGGRIAGMGDGNPGFRLGLGRDFLAIVKEHTDDTGV
jgi:hypothetical protein